jgi:hypothetical protein
MLSSSEDAIVRWFFFKDGLRKRAGRSAWMFQVLVGCFPGPARRCAAGWLVLSRTQQGRDGAVAPAGGAMMVQDGILKA